MATPSGQTDKNKLSSRAQTRAVSDYLRAIESQSRARSRQRPAEEIEAEAAHVEQELDDAVGTRRLDLLQQRENLQREALEVQEAPAENLQELEDRFVEAAHDYGERKGISYSTWREFGVDKAVLERARIPRTRRPFGSS